MSRVAETADAPETKLIINSFGPTTAQDRRASTSHLACLSQIGVHHDTHGLNDEY